MTFQLVSWESRIFILLLGITLSYSSYRLSLLWRLMLAHQKTNRWDHLKKRFVLFLINVLGQKAVLEKPLIGMMHSIIFWGFLLISIGTLEQFCTTLYPWAQFHLLLGEPLYGLLTCLQDLLTGGVLMAVGYAFYRRLILRPPGLGKSHDAIIILTLTGSLMLSILCMNSFQLLTHDLSFSTSLPISSLFTHILKLLPLSPELYAPLSHGFKWVHMLIVLGFSAYIPSSKHLHVLAAGPNTFFQTLQSSKPMTPIAFEDESIQQYGAAKTTDLNWKDVLDYYSCTECGRCQDLCPAHRTQKPLSPKMLIIHLKQNLFHNRDSILNHKPDAITPIIDDNITEDVIWACTSCRACEIACPVFIGHTDKIYAIRRNLVMMESKFPPEVQPIFKNMETNATPWAFSSSDRAHWAQGLDIRTMAEQPTIDVLLWVGCAGSYDDRNQKIIKAFVQLLKKAAIQFAILGNEEKCTGDPARRIGNEYLYQNLAKANIETLNRYQIKKIVTACPHCFNTLKNEYPDFGGHYEVIHHSEFIASLITTGKLKPVQTPNQTMTFHDSCYLGRWNQIYQAPRTILESLPEVQIKEMENHHEKSLCCGAGGGRMWMEEKIGERINIARTHQVIQTQASTVVASCPFCMTMLTDGIRSENKQDQIAVLDIAEIVERSL